MQESDNLPERDSKSLRKKQMLALQKIGEALVNLSAPELAKIPLEWPLSDAIDEARLLTSHEARRRQLQFIGKLMRNVDVQPIEEALNKIQLKGQYSKAKFHQVERWRDKLIAQQGDETAQEFLNKFPHANSQHLRQLIRNAQKDVKLQKNSGADTALFRYLREVIEQEVD
jgi:ribosome-associated protein